MVTIWSIMKFGKEQNFARYFNLVKKKLVTCFSRFLPSTCVNARYYAIVYVTLNGKGVQGGHHSIEWFLKKGLCKGCGP